MRNDRCALTSSLHLNYSDIVKNLRHIPERISGDFYCLRQGIQEQKRVVIKSSRKSVDIESVAFPAMDTSCWINMDRDLCIFKSQLADELRLVMHWSPPLSNHKTFKSSVLYNEHFMNQLAVNFDKLFQVLQLHQHHWNLHCRHHHHHQQ